MTDLNQLPGSAHVRDGPLAGRARADAWVDEHAMRRLLRLQAPLPYRHIEAALAKCGKRIELTVRDAAEEPFGGRFWPLLNAIRSARLLPQQLRERAQERIDVIAGARVGGKRPRPRADVIRDITLQRDCVRHEKRARIVRLRGQQGVRYERHCCLGGFRSGGR
jgi:hypothetical protein